MKYSVIVAKSGAHQRELYYTSDNYYDAVAAAYRYMSEMVTSPFVCWVDGTNQWMNLQEDTKIYHVSVEDSMSVGRRTLLRLYPPIDPCSV